MPTVPVTAPTTNNQVASKKYVDDTVGINISSALDEQEVVSTELAEEAISE